MLLVVIFLSVAATCLAQQPIPAVLSQVIIDRTQNGTCPAADVSERARNAAKIEIQDTLHRLVILGNNTHPQCPCGGPGEWTRIVHLNMSDTSQQCPANWNFITTPVRGCGRTSSGCQSAIFSSNGHSYSRVCGKVLAYQRGSTDAFEFSLRSDSLGLEGAYLDGVSLTHGAAGSRQHIWSFAAALYESDPNYNPLYVCSCTNIQERWPYQLPSFINNNYFCDTSNPGPRFTSNSYYNTDDPLWDGEGCGPTNGCCEFNNPPWFCTTLPQPTTDDLEIRNCGYSPTYNDDTVISMIEVNIA